MKAGDLERLQTGLARLADAAASWEPPGGAPAEAGEAMAADKPLPADLTVVGVCVTYPSGVGGAGNAGEPVWAAAVLMRGDEVIAEACERGSTGGPYVAGLLALRCGPLLERAVRGSPPRLPVSRRSQAGLPEIRGTRSTQKVVASRGKGGSSRKGSCYYSEPGAAA
jgi:hypothetical protein